MTNLFPAFTMQELTEGNLYPSGRWYLLSSDRKEVIGIFIDDNFSCVQVTSPNGNNGVTLIIEAA